MRVFLFALTWFSRRGGAAVRTPFPHSHVSPPAEGTSGDRLGGKAVAPASSSVRWGVCGMSGPSGRSRPFAMGSTTSSERPWMGAERPAGRPPGPRGVRRQCGGSPRWPYGGGPPVGRSTPGLRARGYDGGCVLMNPHPPPLPPPPFTTTTYNPPICRITRRGLLYTGYYPAKICLWCSARVGICLASHPPCP